jgi:CheY-like chemotaxis protein
MLEGMGVECRAVGSTNAMRAVLDRRRWDLLLVDVDLPDSVPGEAIRLALSRGLAAVALVRDAEDRALAARCGASECLRKPYDEEEVRRLLLPLLLARGPLP